MTSIQELILDNVDALAESYRVNIVEPTHAMDELAQDLRRNGKLIRSFEEKSTIQDLSLAAIDGGRASQNLSGGDLIVVGATLGEGARSQQVYNDLDRPALFYGNIIPHSHSLDSNLPGTIMSALELRILNEATTDYKIIDGAYLGNASQALFGALQGNTFISQELFKHDQDDKLSEAITQVLHPPRDNSSRIVALPKSDSSFYYVNEFLPNQKGSSLKTSDRLLANTVLRPGEFFSPRPLVANPALVQRIDQTLARQNISAQERAFLEGRAGLLRRLDRSIDDTEERLLWTTYFKPTEWPQEAKTIKIEFVYYPSKGKGMDEFARELIETINQDIVDEAVLEPWSQYIADVGAKEVGAGIDFVKQHLLNQVETRSEAYGLLNGYRS